MSKWLSLFIILHKQTLQAKAGQYLKLKKLKLDTWADGIKLGRRADILSVFALSALISKHTLIHLRNGNIWMTMETSNMDHDKILKDCDIHLAYLGNGLFSEIKQKMRDCDFTQEPRTCKLANTTTRVKPTSSAEFTSKVTSKYVQTQNIFTSTTNIKCEHTGTTSTTVIKSSTHGTGDISSTCATADIFAGTPVKVVNIDPDTELAGTTILDKTKVTDDFSVVTTERVIGNIDADASTLQLLVSENTRPKGADASCRKIGHDTHSAPPIDQNQYHVHATHGNTAVKDVQINLKRITDLDIDLWMALKPTTYLDDENPIKPVHMQMLKGDIDTNDDNIITTLRTDKQTIKRSKKKATAGRGKRSKMALLSTRPSAKPALVSRHGFKSTPILGSRTRMQKIRSGAKSLAFKITVHGLKKFRHMQGPSSFSAHNSVEVLFVVFVCIKLLGNVVRVYPRIVQGLTFLSA